MTRLDEIYDKLGIHQGHTMPDTADEFRKVLSSEIKALFLELIGEDEPEAERGTRDHTYGYDNVRNSIRAELRQKVEEL